MKKRVPVKYDIMKDIYDRVVVNIKICNGLINDFLSQLDYIKDLL